MAYKKLSDFTAEEALELRDGARLRKLETMAFLGDSRTNGDTWQKWARARLMHALMPSLNVYPQVGPPYVGTHFGYDGTTADQLLYATVNERSDGADQWPDVTLTPLKAAAATNPGGFMTLIGTNNFPNETAEQTLLYVEDILNFQRKTGAMIFIGEELPRAASVADPSGTYQAKVNTYNAALPALAAKYGAIIIPWHDALAVDGVANPALYNDDDAGAGTIYVHPNLAGNIVMGDIFADTVLPYLGDPYPLPVKGAVGWVTSNPFLDIDAGSNGIADGLTSPGSGTPSIVTDDDDVVWQQWTLTEAGNVFAYCPAFVGDWCATLVASGWPVRAACEIQIVEGTCTTLALQGGTMDVSYQPVLNVGHYLGISDATGSFDGPKRGLLMTPEHVIPDGSVFNSLQIVAHFSGPAVFRARRFGWFRSPY